MVNILKNMLVKIEVALHNHAIKRILRENSYLLTKEQIELMRRQIR